MSWNVFLLPALFHNNIYQRTQKIIEYLDSVDCDIICLQEVFDPKAYKMITSGLFEKYPYQSGRPHKEIYKVASSGLLILSKTPFNKLSFDHFNMMVHLDAFSAKGIQLVEFENFFLINTHFQAQCGLLYEKLREVQIKMLKAKIERYPELIICGDLNINRYSIEYLKIADSIKSPDLIENVSGNTFLSDQDCFLDYNFCTSKSINTQQNSFEIISSIKDQKLSDHLPVKSTYTITKT